MNKHSDDLHDYAYLFISRIWIYNSHKTMVIIFEMISHEPLNVSKIYGIYINIYYLRRHRWTCWKLNFTDITNNFINQWIYKLNKIVTGIDLSNRWFRGASVVIQRCLFVLLRNNAEVKCHVSSYCDGNYASVKGKSIIIIL